MASFDVVSKLDHHEVDNALDQARREISQRYDFKGTDTSLEKSEEGILIKTKSASLCAAALEVLRGKLAKRGVSQKALDPGAPAPAGGDTYRVLVKLREGSDQEHAKKIVKLLKDAKTLKVQAAIQGDVVRVSHKKRDVLQDAIQLLKEQDLPLPLQYQNFRD